MITLYSWPKPMEGEFGQIQYNALMSWKEIKQAEVYLIDNETHDLEDIADNIGAVVIDIERNEFGTPVLSEVINDMYSRGNEYNMWVNTDIILPNFREVVLDVIDYELGEFMVVTTRWDVDMSIPYSYHENWVQYVYQRTLTSGQLHKPCGSDVFIWKGDWLKGVVPDFALARAAWDNWLMWKTLDLGLPLVDATRSIITIHQEHGGRVWDGPEVQGNRDVCGGRMKDVKHATYTYDAFELKRK